MNAITVFEFDRVVEEDIARVAPANYRSIFAWLEAQCLRDDKDAPRWAKLSQRGGSRAVQICNYAGVIQTPGGFQIEVLPKIYKNTGEDESDENKENSRNVLIDMLKCLPEFRHIKATNADLKAQSMPLMEVFIQQFLQTATTLVRRGFRSDYIPREDNLFSLRGKLLVAQHLLQNTIRRDRFFCRFDEFSHDRAENRLIHSALKQVLSVCRFQENQRIARELSFIFSEVPTSTNIESDLGKIRLDRGMSYYKPALDWATLILRSLNPVGERGKSHAPSLLFPMETLFEAYVAKHLRTQIGTERNLKTQEKSQHLVSHNNQNWFNLKPDLMVESDGKNHLVLDTKWKRLDTTKNNGTDKYQLSQSDFYQLYAYGHHYLESSGDLILIYPKSALFSAPLPVFSFPKTPELRLWVVPFCFQQKKIICPAGLRLVGQTNTESNN